MEVLVRNGRIIGRILLGMIIFVLIVMAFYAFTSTIVRVHAAEINYTPVPHVIFVHRAPSGFEYPSDCCNGQDCHPVACDALVEKEDGVHYLNATFSSSQVKPSGDNECHVCISYTNDQGGHPIPYPHCVFIRPSS